jgi:hypothetical protein
VLPPFPGIAVKVTGAFSHAGLALGVIDTDAAIEPTTVIVTEFEVTVTPGEHDDDDVSSAVTTSPLASEALTKVGLLVPTFDPFTFHW